MIFAHDSYRVAIQRLGVLIAAAVIACGMIAAPAVAEPSEHPFEILPGSFHVTPSTLQAGSHGDLTVAFDLAHQNTEQANTDNDARTTVVNLPPGFIGNATAAPTCTPAQLLTGKAYENQCPIASQVGQISLETTDPQDQHSVHLVVPIYNMETTSFGTTAEFGFKTVVFTQLFLVSVRAADTGLTITAPDITKQLAEPRNISATVWGLPAAHGHDAQRGEVCDSSRPVEPCFNLYGGPQEAHIPVKPFLANPTSCGPFKATMQADSWEDPNQWSEAETEIGSVTECDRVPFEPSIEASPTTVSAESPSGLDVSINVPQTWDEPFTIATSDLKDAKVTLPVGFTINPSAGSGLGACTEAQLQQETSSSLPGEGCPPESKIGSIEIETPLLAEKAYGAVYVARPFHNPFGSLLSLYIVARIPARGVIVKVAGEVHLDAVTGQLTTTFLNNPQQPFNRFTLKFRPGATAPLVSAPVCGAYAAEAALTPWSAPGEPHFLSSPAFTIVKGVHEGPCPSGGVPPFHPQVISGTENNSAGSYSPFYLRVIREDGEQEITRFSTTLPPGLTGNLTGIPFCPDADIEAAKSVSGAQEEANSSCPAASMIGHTIVEAGVGSVLAQTPGKVYLAGPYHGAPLSVVSITSAKVGPFDLGTVVIRFELDINPTTAQVEVSANGSDPIPHIIKGIVVHVRDIRVYMDRNQFILNPTNCQPLSITDTIDGAGADLANPADEQPVSINTPFEAADCSSLQFNPDLAVSTSAKTSRADGASLTAKLTVPGALGTQANISRVKVELPKALPSRLTTLQKACTAAQFEANPAGCPPASIIGHAKAITPILPVPLEGPAYFVSHGGEAFPDLEIVLQGYGFTIDLTATTFISKQGVTSSTFKAVPDQPVASFELTLPGGPYSALTALGNLCTAKNLTMPTELIGQNGAEIKQSTKIAVSGCPKHKKAAKKKAHHRRKKQNRKKKTRRKKK